MGFAGVAWTPDASNENREQNIAINVLSNQNLNWGCTISLLLLKPFPKFFITCHKKIHNCTMPLRTCSANCPGRWFYILKCINGEKISAFFGCIYYLRCLPFAEPGFKGLFFVSDTVISANISFSLISIGGLLGRWRHSGRQIPWPFHHHQHCHRHFKNDLYWRTRTPLFRVPVNTFSFLTVGKKFERLNN